MFGHDYHNSQVVPPQNLSGEILSKQMQHSQHRPCASADMVKERGPCTDEETAEQCELVQELREMLDGHHFSLQRRLDVLSARQEEIYTGLMQMSSSTDFGPSSNLSPTSPRSRRTVRVSIKSPQETVNADDALTGGSGEAMGLVSRAYRIRSTRTAEKWDCAARNDIEVLPVDPEPVRRESCKSEWSADLESRAMSINQPALETSEGSGQAGCGGCCTGGRRRVSFVGETKSLSWGNLFDFASGSMIVANALLMGVETEYSAHHFGRSHVSFVYAQLALNIWFTCELALRLLADRCLFWATPEWKWYLFDALLVGFSVVDLIEMMRAGIASSAAGTGRFMRIIKLARVVRIMRLFRSLNNIHQFRKMIYCLQSSLSTLAWALLLLIGVMYAFAVLFVQAVAEYSGQHAQSELAVLLTTEYGNLLRAVATLYKAVTGGQSWTVLMDPLVEVDGTFQILFLVYISIVFFGVLNVVTAVFVESAMDSAAHYKDLRIYEARKAKADLVKHMRQIFCQMDKDGSGTISFEEMDFFLHDPQLKLYVESLDVTVEDTAMLFELMDLDDSGVVDINEFCNGLLRLQGDARSFDVHLLIFEMAKFQSKWDKFVSYVQSKFDEVVGAMADDAQEVPMTPSAVFPGGTSEAYSDAS